MVLQVDGTVITRFAVLVCVATPAGAGVNHSGAIAGRPQTSIAQNLPQMLAGSAFKAMGPPITQRILLFLIGVLAAVELTEGDQARNIGASLNLPKQGNLQDVAHTPQTFYPARFT